MSLSIPTGTSLCNTPDEISAWELGILTKIRVETHITNKASLVALITGLAQCALKDDAGVWHIEATKRHLAALTGLSPSAVWRGLKWLGEERLLLLEHSASMRSRCERSLFYPLLPAGTNARDFLKNYSVALPRSLSPVSLHSKSSGASWSERENAPVTSLSDPRHNVWYGRRTAWLVYATMGENWAMPMTMLQIRQETGLSFHALKDAIDWMVSEGLITWADQDGRWEHRMVELVHLGTAAEQELDRNCFDRRGELLARIRAEREVHRLWIAAGCKTKFELSQWAQDCYRRFNERLTLRATRMATP